MFELLLVHGSFSKPTVTLNILACSNTSLLTHLTTFNTIPLMVAYILFLFLFIPLMNWPPVFHLQWLGHVPHVRKHVPTTYVWNSLMWELIGSVMVSSLLLPTFGTLSLPLYFRLPSTFLPSKGRPITALGTRWHDFFITLFRCYINLIYSFHCLFFHFLRDADYRKGTLCPFCVPIHKRKKKSIIMWFLPCSLPNHHFASMLT